MPDVMNALSEESFKDGPLVVTVPWKRQLDISDWRHLRWLAILCTAFFAVGYALLTHWSYHHGVKDVSQSHERWWWAFTDGLYFSIATETTVGYGDLAPHGVSRVLACLQVVSGLIIAGLIVSNITDRPSGKLRVLIERMNGAWAEICVKDHGYIISLIYIRFSNGLLRYDGMNFDDDGNFLGTFEGSSEPTNWINGSEICFDYSNEEGDVSYFSSGKTTLCFKFPLGKTPKLDGRGLTKYNYFTGVAHDKDHPEVEIKMVGYRLEEADSKQLISPSTKSTFQRERSRIAKASFAHFKNDARRRYHIQLLSDQE